MFAQAFDFIEVNSGLSRKKKRALFANSTALAQRQNQYIRAIRKEWMSG